MDGRNYFRTKRNTVLWKKLFSLIEHSNLQGKMVFRDNYIESQLFLMSYYFPKTFVHLSVIAVVYYFIVYNWYGGTQQVFTYSNSSETLKECVKDVQR